MRLMVLDVLNTRPHAALAERVGEMAWQVGPMPSPAEAVHDGGSAGTRGQHESKSRPEIRARIVINGDARNIFQPHFACGKAILDRAYGKARPVLRARETLFLGGGDDQAV